MGEQPLGGCRSAAKGPRCHVAWGSPGLASADEIQFMLWDSHWPELAEGKGIKVTPSGASFKIISRLLTPRRGFWDHTGALRLPSPG